MFNITCGKGMQMTFANGCTISIQMGEGNYCDNRNRLTEEERHNLRESATAEVAVWDKDGKWLRPTDDWTNDDVIGWISPNDVARIIAVVVAI